MPKRVKLVLVIATLLSAGILSFHQIGCDDHWWHIATGHLMRDRMELPPVDVFSFTYEGAPWRNNEWGFGFVISLVWDYLGETGFFLYRWLVLFGVALFLLLAVEERRRQRDGGAPSFLLYLSLLAFIMLTLQIRIGIRPHLLGYLFLAALVWRLQRPIAWDKPWLLAIMTTLFFASWAFFHYSWTFGFLLAMLAAIDRYVRWRWGSTGKTLYMVYPFLRKHLWYVLIGIFIFSLVGIFVLTSGPIAFILSHLVGLDDTYEWKPYRYWLQLHPFFAVTIPYYLLFLVMLRRTLRTDTFYTLLMIVTMILSFKSLRFMSEFIIISLPLVVNSARLFLKERNYGSMRTMPAVALVVVLWLGVAGSTRSFSDRPWGIGVNVAQNPVSIADFMERNGLSGNLFATNSSFHAYFMYRSWPQIKIFFDGRHKQVYPLSFIQAFSHMSFAEIISRYPMIDYVVKYVEITGIDRRPEDFLEARPSGYELAFFDRHWALFIKAETFQRYPHLKPLRMLYPINIATEGLMRKAIEKGSLPVLKDELVYYGAQARHPEEKQLYDLMRAEIAKYGPVD